MLGIGFDQTSKDCKDMPTTSQLYQYQNQSTNDLLNMKVQALGGLQNTSSAWQYTSVSPPAPLSIQEQKQNINGNGCLACDLNTAAMLWLARFGDVWVSDSELRGTYKEYGPLVERFSARNWLEHISPSSSLRTTEHFYRLVPEKYRR